MTQARYKASFLATTSAQLTRLRVMREEMPTLGLPLAGVVDAFSPAAYRGDSRIFDVPRLMAITAIPFDTAASHHASSAAPARRLQ